MERIPAEIGQRTRRISESKKIKDFLGEAGIEETDHVLDVGSNLGLMAAKIHDKFGCSVTGIEPRLDKVAKTVSNRRGVYRGKDVVFDQASVFELPYEDESYKAVNIRHVIEHFNDEEIVLALSEIKRVLVKGGRVIVTVPKGDDVIANLTAKGHVQKFKGVEELKKLLEKSDFEVVDMARTGYSFVVVGKK